MSTILSSVAGLHSVGSDFDGAKDQRMFALPFAHGRATLVLSVACRYDVSNGNIQCWRKKHA